MGVLESASHQLRQVIHVLTRIVPPRTGNDVYTLTTLRRYAKTLRRYRTSLCTWQAESWNDKDTSPVDLVDNERGC